MKKVFLVLFTLLLVFPLKNVLAANTDINTIISNELEESQIEHKTNDDDSSNTEPEKTVQLENNAENPIEETTKVLITNEIMPSTIDVNDIVPPADITFIIADSLIEEDKPFLLELNWDLPEDEDLSHFRIYRNGQLLEDKYKLFTYIDTDVLPDTIYTYKIVAVDVNNNHSVGFVELIKTDLIEDVFPPLEPTGLILSDGNESGRIIWDRNIETDLECYNVYLNGVLHDSVKTNNYMITGLDNSSTYTIAVTAVDTVGNESVLSASVNLKPNQKPMPTLKSNNNLGHIVDGVNNIFSKFFPLIAYLAGVPIAFYIGMRIKTLILS